MTEPHGSREHLLLKAFVGLADTLNLFHRDPGALPAADLALAQAMADVATIAILQERAIHRGELLTEQPQAALNSRVIIEQAKVMLAERGKLSMDAAFNRLRSYARRHNQRLSELARKLVLDGTITEHILRSSPAHVPVPEQLI